MEENDKHHHQKIKISVSGAAETGHCGPGAMEKAKELGREIVRQGAIIVTGATTGFPLWSAIGAKEEGGVSIGISPALSEREHIEHYNLPVDYMDLIVYTGAGYSGRDILLTRSSDAVLIGCGRVGTIHEFTVAFEDNKPIGILQGPWETDQVIKDIMAKGHRPNPKVIYDEDPKKLIERIIVMIKEDKVKEYKVKGVDPNYANTCEDPVHK
ncbi:MAG: hypothetical protein Q7T49_00820 [bacterium]|nr:hypothetical protein [bacterium]